MLNPCSGKHLFENENVPLVWNDTYVWCTIDGDDNLLKIIPECIYCICNTENDINDVFCQR